MSHIDEGRLHAYLDGEIASPADRERIERHLETCEECRGRLEAERLLSARAAEILAGSGPGAVSQPPFDDIVARSRAGRARSRYVRLRSFTALGWAAAIVLAVGVGWIARGTIGVREPAQEVSAAPSDSASPGISTLTGEAAEEVAARSPADAEPAAGGRGAAQGERTQPEVTAKTEARNEPQLMAEAEREEQPTEADRLAAAAPAAAPQAAPERRARAFADADEPRDEAAAEDARLAVVEGVRADAPQEVREGLLRQWESELDENAWRVAGSEAAEQHIGGPVLLVPGLDVIAYRLGEMGGVPSVRTVQQLPSGEALELIQRRAEAAQPAAVGGVESAVEQARHQRDSVVVGAPAEAIATVRRGGYLITGWAALPNDSLVALLESIPQ